MPLLLAAFSGAACGTDSVDTESNEDSASGTDGDVVDPSEVVDFKDVILESRSPDCGDYVGTFTASVSNIQENTTFTENVSISKSLVFPRLRPARRH